MNRFFESLKNEDKSVNTIAEYDSRLKKFMSFLDERKIKVEDVTITDLVEFKNYLLDLGVGPRRINNIFSTIRCYYDYLLLNGYVDTNPVSVAFRLKVKTKRKERLSDENILAFRRYVDSLQPNQRSAFLLMLATGARVGEIAKLRKKDFSIENDKLHINIIDAKWDSDRKIPVLDNDIAIIVAKYLTEIDNVNLPAFRVSKRTLQRTMTNFSESTGIDCHCHLLRHTFASLLTEQGVSIEVIRYFLGHKNINMTAHYTQSATIDLSNVKATIWQNAIDG